MEWRKRIDSPIIYRIEVAGEVGSNWQDWLDQRKVSILSADPGKTILMGVFDQAGLLGLLRRFYYMGLPLISVNYMEQDQNRERSYSCESNL